FEDNLVVSLVRRFATQDEDENPSYYLPNEVQGLGSPNARAFRLEDLFGACVLLDGRLQGRPTTRVRQAADKLNHAPDRSQLTPLRWCPYSVGGFVQTTFNSAATSFNQGIQNPMNPFGARLQTVWRELDLSLSHVDPADFDLDVEQMFWAPFQSSALM